MSGQYTGYCILIGRYTGYCNLIGQWHIQYDYDVL